MKGPNGQNIWIDHRFKGGRRLTLIWERNWSSSTDGEKNAKNGDREDVWMVVKLEQYRQMCDEDECGGLMKAKGQTKMWGG